MHSTLTAVSARRARRDRAVVARSGGAPLPAPVAAQ